MRPGLRDPRGRPRRVASLLGGRVTWACDSSAIGLGPAESVEFSSKPAEDIPSSLDEVPQVFTDGQDGAAGFLGADLLPSPGGGGAGRVAVGGDQPSGR